MLGYQRKKKLKSVQLYEFCMHTGAMLGAGVPLVKAMGILQEGAMNRRICGIYKDLERRMQTGKSFSLALEETGVFPELLLNMFRAADWRTDHIKGKAAANRLPACHKYT